MGPQLSSRARTLRRACAFLVLAIPAAAGCRGIIGIEPLEIADGGVDGGRDARGAVDASADAAGGGDAGGGEAGGGDASAYAACVQEGSSMCRPCCHATFSGASMQLGQTAIGAGCMCADAGGECQSECASSLCVQKAPSMTCGPCFDNAVLSPSTPTCTQAVSECEGSSSCHDIIDCMKACP